MIEKGQFTTACDPSSEEDMDAPATNLEYWNHCDIHVDSTKRQLGKLIRF
jgi:hypothetical protein